MSEFTPEVIQVLNDGVIVVKHPLRDAFIFLHRLAVELRIGKTLTFDDVVYFKNGNKQDRESKNLVLTSRKEYFRAWKSKKWPYLSKLTLWLLYHALHLSTTTIGMIFDISPSLTRAMFEYRRVKRVPRGKLTRRWNKLARGLIGFIRS